MVSLQHDEHKYTCINRYQAYISDYHVNTVNLYNKKTHVHEGIGNQ